VAAEGGGADASSPPPPQESAPEQAGGGGRGTHGSGSVAVGANLKAKGPGDIPPGPSSPDRAGPSGAGTSSPESLDSKELFEVFAQLVRDAGAEKKRWTKKTPDEEQVMARPVSRPDFAISWSSCSAFLSVSWFLPPEQVKSARPKKGLWSKLKNLFTRRKKVRPPESGPLLLARSLACDLPARLCICVPNVNPVKSWDGLE
jgi:hypothetical protein